MGSSPTAILPSGKLSARRTCSGSLHFSIMLSNIDEAWWAADLLKQL